MLRRQRQIRKQIHQVVDAGLFALSFWLAHGLRWQAQNAFPRIDKIQPFEIYLWLFLLIVPLAFFLLESQGFYNRPLLASRRLAAWRLFKASLLSVVGVIFAMFLLREQLARSVIMSFGGLAFLLVLAKEELIRHWGRTKLGQAQILRRFILVGTPVETTRLLTEMQGESQSDIEILTRFDLNEAPAEKLADLLHEHSANGVILSAKNTLFGDIERAIEVCELEGVEVWLLADFFKTQISQTTVDDFHGRPTLVFRSAPEASWQGVAKQLMDVVGAALMLLVVGPFIMLPAALLIRLSSPGPIFFRQQRSGLNGRPFTMLKFRSMETDAEQRQQELAAFNELAGPVFKVTNDPRITPVGRWLRKHSIDELPQLWNVLRGEMSLVGPRPLPVDEVRRFNDLAHRRRLSVKPGLTCLWQVGGRSDVKDFRDWVRLDLEYIDNWSLWLDFKILLRTIPVVLLGTGAK